MIRRIEISFVVIWQQIFQNICFDYVLNEFPICEKVDKNIIFLNIGMLELRFENLY